MDIDALSKALKAFQKNQKYAFATIVESTVKGTPRKIGAKMTVYEDGSLFGSIGGGRNELAVKKECLKSIKSEKPKMVAYDYFGKTGQSVCGGKIKVFIEPFIPIKNFIICGAGHIALPLSISIKLLGYKVTIIDDRKNFANKKRFSHVDSILVGSHAKKLAKVSIDSNTYIMIVTQGNEYDFECLKVVVESEARYIGVISSTTKKKIFFDRLKKIGISQKHLKRIHIPAGLDIGAQTPEEIAISITSEVIKLTNNFFLGTDKFKKGA